MKTYWHTPANTRFLEELPGTIQFHNSWEASYLLPGPSVSQHVEQVKIICVDHMEKVRGMLHNAVVKKSKYSAMYMLPWIRLFNRLFLFLKAGKIQKVQERIKHLSASRVPQAAILHDWHFFKPVEFGLNSLLVGIGQKKSHKSFK